MERMRFGCSVAGEPYACVMLDGVTASGVRALLLEMADRAGRAVGPVVRAEFSMLSDAFDEKGEIVDVVRRAIPERFVAERWPERLLALKEKNIATLQRWRVG